MTSPLAGLDAHGRLSVHTLNTQAKVTTKVFFDIEVGGEKAGRCVRGRAGGWEGRFLRAGEGRCP